MYLKAKSIDQKQRISIESKKYRLKAKNIDWKQRISIEIKEYGLKWKSIDWKQRISIESKEYWLKTKNIDWNQRILIEMKEYRLKAKSKWFGEIKLLVGGFFYHFPAGGDLLHHLTLISLFPQSDFLPQRRNIIHTTSRRTTTTEDGRIRRHVRPEADREKPRKRARMGQRTVPHETRPRMAVRFSFSF